jgi:hypothetical protein
MLLLKAAAFLKSICMHLFRALHYYTSYASAEGSRLPQIKLLNYCTMWGPLRDPCENPPRARNHSN